MKISCQIIEDLLPLYAENLVSEDSKQLVENHLKECQHCQEVLKNSKLPSISIQSQENKAEPIKKIKKKLKKRTILTVCISVVLVIALIGTIFSITPPSIDYGESELFSLSERKAAAMLVKEKVNGFQGCKLYSIRYEGDASSLKEAERQNRQNPGKYTDVIVFQSFFRSPITGGGAWEANQIYSWSWIVGRTDGGAWKLISWGYA